MINPPPDSTNVPARKAAPNVPSAAAPLPDPHPGSSRDSSQPRGSPGPRPRSGPRSRYRFRPPDAQRGMFVHVVSRIVNRACWFDDDAKRHFRCLLRRYEAFGCLRIVTYCLMGNHFHILIEIPRRPDTPPGEADMLAHVAATLGQSKADDLTALFALWRSNGSAALIQREIQALWARMYDLSAFMATLKQTFTVWFNRKTRRKGTLWEERFRSVLVEGAGNTLAAMAAYIDLNPVRAGLVADPKDYRWSGYAESVAGNEKAREGIAVIVAARRQQDPRHTQRDDWRQVHGHYRMWLYHRGREVPSAAEEKPQSAHGGSHGGKSGATTAKQRGFSPKEIERVEKKGGKLSLAELVRVRVRHFTDGGAVGSREFIEAVFAAARERFGPKRTTGARPLRMLEPSERIHALRDLGKGDQEKG